MSRKSVMPCLFVVIIQLMRAFRMLHAMLPARRELHLCRGRKVPRPSHVQGHPPGTIGVLGRGLPAWANSSSSADLAIERLRGRLRRHFQRQLIWIAERRRAQSGCQGLLAAERKSHAAPPARRLPCTPGAIGRRKSPSRGEFFQQRLNQRGEVVSNAGCATREDLYMLRPLRAHR